MVTFKTKAIQADLGIFTHYSGISMTYSTHGHISYILAANSKRPIRKKKKKTKYSYVEEIEWADFFSFLTKIFHNI